MIRKITVCLFLAILFLSAFIYFLSFSVEPVSIKRFNEVSRVILDDNNRNLNIYLTPSGYWRMTTSAEDIREIHLNGLLAYEDKRFYSHPGVDPIALARAALQWVIYQKPVSGASTITMQVVRLLGYKRRDLKGKIVQIAQALKLERSFSKHQILSMYLTLTPFGGNIEGINAASLAYFGKKPLDLDLAQIALLIAVPQSPETRRIDKAATEHLQTARNLVLNRLVKAELIEQSQAAITQTIAIGNKRRILPNFTPHLGVRLISQHSTDQSISTYINLDLQKQVNRLAKSTVSQLEPGTNIAIIVVRNKDYAVRAYLGGTDYFNTTNPDYNDLAIAQRSPGSTLKPIIYGMAFEQLIVHPETLIVDSNRQFTGYAPENFEQISLGEITVREALTKSLNTTAVLLLRKVGVPEFLSRLRIAGSPLELDQPDTHAGLSVGLGGGGASLADLTKTYAGIANRGVVKDLKYTKAQVQSETSLRILSEESAWAVTDILADTTPPKSSTALNNHNGLRRVAFKTGTSYGFRDAWAIGFDHLHTVGIWVGRSDSLPNSGYNGLKVAAPVLFQLFDVLPYGNIDVANEPPEDTILTKYAELPKRLQRFRSGPSFVNNDGLRPLMIDYPMDNTELEIMDENPPRTIQVAARGGKKPYFWFINGAPLSADKHESGATWNVTQPGQHEISVVDYGGSEYSVNVWIE